MEVLEREEEEERERTECFGGGRRKNKSKTLDHSETGLDTGHGVHSGVHCLSGLQISFFFFPFAIPGRAAGYDLPVVSQEKLNF